MRIGVKYHVTRLHLVMTNFSDHYWNLVTLGISELTNSIVSRCSITMSMPKLHNAQRYEWECITHDTWHQHGKWNLPLTYESTNLSISSTPMCYTRYHTITKLCTSKDHLCLTNNGCDTTLIIPINEGGLTMCVRNWQRWYYIYLRHEINATKRSKKPC